MKTRRWWLPVILVALAAALAGARPVLTLIGTVDAQATPHPAASAPGGAAPRPEEKHVFDYFPDHYVNQARQPAEPIDQF